MQKAGEKGVRVAGTARRSCSHACAPSSVMPPETRRRREENDTRAAPAVLSSSRCSGRFSASAARRLLKARAAQQAAGGARRPAQRARSAAGRPSAPARLRRAAIGAAAARQRVGKRRRLSVSAARREEVEMPCRPPQAPAMHDAAAQRRHGEECQRQPATREGRIQPACRATARYSERRLQRW